MVGDALAMTVLVEKGFKPEDFANLHPAGKLGKKLRRVEQMMNSGEALPVAVQEEWGRILGSQLGASLAEIVADSVFCRRSNEHDAFFSTLTTH